MELMGEGDRRGAPRCVLVGRQGCHLCDEARDVVARVAQETGMPWEEVDIDDRPGAAAAYSDQIPVVLVDGAQHDFWRVDEERLRAALAGGRRGRRVGARRVTWISCERHRWSRLCAHVHKRLWWRASARTGPPVASRRLLLGRGLPWPAAGRRVVRALSQ